MPFNPSSLATYSQKPGIYLMRSKSGAVLYVGKAKNLKSRLKQYFQKGGDGRSMIPFLISKVEAIETIVTTSEEEALVLENNLIKQHRPRYNILYRDDKSYICLSINTKHTWPTVKIKRSHKTTKKKGERLFGPYPGPFAARAALKEIYRYFKLRQCSDRELASRKRPCILYDMGRCPAPCVGLISEEEYGLQVKRAESFLKGERKDLINHLQTEMEKASEALAFEKALALQRQIKDLEKMHGSKSFVENPELGSCDVIGVFRDGGALCFTTLVIRSGKLIGSEEFFVNELVSETPEATELFLMQRLMEAFDPPEEIIVRSLESSPKSLETWALGEKERPIKISMPKRGIKEKVLSLAEENAQSNYTKHQDADAKALQNAVGLGELLDISAPSFIECIDQSHLGGQGMVSAIVAFKDGKKSPQNYRRFSLRDANPGDDVGALKEALRRHYNKVSPSNLPDLLIVDGGRAQANAAAAVLLDLNISTIHVIGLAKDKSRHDKGMTAEVIFSPGSSPPLHLDPKSPLLFFLQQIRDEAHRFVITYQKKKRSRSLIKSHLDDIEGIGPKKKAALLRHFGSVATLKESSLEEITLVAGISEKDAKRIAEFFELS